MTYLRSALFLIAATATAVTGGCVADHYGPDDGGMSRKTLEMSVTVVVNGSHSTRAHADDSQQQGTPAENYIDFANGDFRLALYDKNGSYLREIDLQESQWTVIPSSSANATYYLFECEVDFGDVVTEEQLEAIRKDGLRVLALANWINAGGTYEMDENEELRRVWKNRTDYNFNLYNAAASYSTWRPSLPDGNGNNGKHIPMFGISTSSGFQPRTEGASYAIATIQMQRAVAKIEVIDNLVEQPNVDIAGVTMTKFNTVGRFIPDVDANPDWNKVGSQVSTSSVPANPLQAGNLAFVKEGSAWVAYVPEMALEKPENNVFNDSRAHLEVAISGIEANGQNANYQVHFGRYNQNFKPTIPEGDDSWNHILRNHIYRFSVNKVGLSLELHLHVLPWVPEEDEMWDFTDHVSISKELVWLPETYENSEAEVAEKGNLVLSLESDKILTGEFCFMSPVNARWYARLTFLEGANPNAVSFCDSKGNITPAAGSSVPVVHEISGTIRQNGDESRDEKIYICATGSDGEYESRFRLTFYVENFGSWIEVPMTSGTYSYYTIIRPGNIIE